VRHRKVLGLIILLTGISFSAHQAEAGLRFCNQGKFKFLAVVGYVDRQKGWVAKGWLPVEPGECRDALQFPLDNRYYYYYAAGHDEENALVKYAGEHPFCVESRKFMIYQSDYGKSTDEECAKAGLRSVKFLKVDVQGKPEFTINLGGPDNPPPGGGETPGRPPVAAVPPPAAQQPPPAAVQAPAVRQPPPTAMQQPPSGAEPPAVSADPPTAPLRRRQQNHQEGPPNVPPDLPAAQGGGQDGTACKRYPNLC
jgi:uncharacterized membrane protein